MRNKKKFNEFMNKTIEELYKINILEPLSDMFFHIILLNII